MIKTIRLFLLLSVVTILFLSGCGKVSNSTGVDPNEPPGGLIVLQLVPTYNTMIQHPYPEVLIKFNEELHPTQSVPYGAIEISGEVLPVTEGMISGNEISGRINVKLPEGEHYLRINTNLKSRAGHTLQSPYRHRLKLKTKYLSFYKTYKAVGFAVGIPVSGPKENIYIGTSRLSSQPASDQNVVLCLGPTLEEVWTCNIGKAEIFGEGTVDQAGNLYMPIVRKRDVQPLYSQKQGNAELSVIKISPEGKMLWETQTIGTRYNQKDSYSVYLTEEENVLVGGDNIYLIDRHKGQIIDALFDYHSFVVEHLLNNGDGHYFALGVDGSDHQVKTVAFDIQAETLKIVWRRNMGIRDTSYLYRTLMLSKAGETLITGIEHRLIQMSVDNGEVVAEQKLPTPNKISSPVIPVDEYLGIAWVRGATHNRLIQVNMSTLTVSADILLPDRPMRLISGLQSGRSELFLLNDMSRGDYYVIDPYQMKVKGIIPLSLSDYSGLDGVALAGDQLVIATPRQDIDLDNDGLIDDRSFAYIYVFNKQILDDPLETDTILPSLNIGGTR